ncbi:MAG: hypothetical protein AB1899_11775 [Pseudomonadota bacterium]
MSTASCSRPVGPGLPHQAILLMAALMALPALADQTDPGLAGTWRITHALPAPWGAALPGSSDLAGQTLRVSRQAMAGPGPLACAAPKLEPTRYPAQGLFQGNLAAPAEQQARQLGLGQFPVSGIRATCAKGIFEFHRADPDTLLLGLDNRVWILSRAPGTQVRANSPAGRVESLLERHFGGDMGFGPATAPAKAPFQSKRLNQMVADYLARPRTPDQVPPINGDPYTASQEYPTRFAVGVASLGKQRARVPVRFADAWGQRMVTYDLVLEDGGWRVDDLDFGHGTRLSALLHE